MNQNLWGKPKKATLKTSGKAPNPFAKMSLKDMKTSTLSENKGRSKQIFKSIGF